MRNEGTQVFTFEWDLSKGLLYGVVSHVGILAFGTFYEYCKEGIEIIKVLPGCLPPDPKHGYPTLHYEIEIGRTRVTEKDFNTWVSSQSSDKFKAENYNIVTNNCIGFAIEACEFLRVKAPIHWFILKALIFASNRVTLPLLSAISGLFADHWKVLFLFSENTK
ncbi:unnamed protein product [Allacma fusca]|uniref:PPPDE domain-containing protein n=1 Tax=Allacma fusca TaxID=39272 RepID=A0A8J2K3A0_9HEXA|nr:unnamed protein product [Allacma fusca]